MKVKVKSFAIDMEVKTSGMELEVRTPDGGAQVGDCYVTKTGLTLRMSTQFGPTVPTGVGPI